MEQAGYPTGGGAEGNGALLHTEEELLTEEFTQVKVLVGSLWLRGKGVWREGPEEQDGQDGCSVEWRGLWVGCGCSSSRPTLCPGGC